MKNILTAILFFMPITARAAGSGCQNTSGGLTLEKIRSTAQGTEIIGCINRTFDILSSSTVYYSSTTPQQFSMLAVSTLVANNASGIYVSSPIIFGQGINNLGPSTATYFYGNGSGMTDMTVAYSSAPAHTADVSNTSYVGLASTTFLSMHGSEPVNVFATAGFQSTGGAKTYTCILTRDGTNIDGTYTQTNGGGDVQTFVVFADDDNVAAGTHTYAILCKTSAAGGTQTATNIKLRVLEF